MGNPWVMPGLERRTTEFDFLVGNWHVTNHRLRRPLTNEEEWRTTTSSARATTLQNGAISIDEMWFADEQFAGSSVRLYDPLEQNWTIYWVNSRTGRLQAPVVGRWRDGQFTAEGPDEYDHIPLIATYHWHSITETTAVWEQAFSPDNRRTWQTNWIMEWRRETD